MHKRKLELDKELLTADRSGVSLDGGSNYLACTMGCTFQCITNTCPATQTCVESCVCDTAGCGTGGGGGTSVDNIPNCDITV